ncbi:hypothetical protein KEJ15_04720, partial [Candidatus Bathyarchaeota archaeon]|nr:hypothetical protein [Candidatus Bathyarchaeota archaeon]
MKLFLKNRRATLGLVIIFGFVVVAIAAPLLTPYDAVGTDPNFLGFVAAKYAKPSWFMQLPTYLGGNPHLSYNLEAITNPSLPKLWPEGNLSFSALRENASGSYVDAAEYFDTRFVEDVDYPYKVLGMGFPHENGSLAITFSRNGTLLGETKAYVRGDFDWPYSGIPGIIIGNVELLADGTKHIEWQPMEQWYIVLLTGGKETKYINVSISSSSAQGLHVAASTNITNYFGPLIGAGLSYVESKWNFTGYHTWKEWLNGTTLTTNEVVPTGKSATIPAGTMFPNGTVLERDKVVRAGAVIPAGTVLPNHWDVMSWVVNRESLTEMTYEAIRNATNPYPPLLYEDTGNVTYYSFANSTTMCDSNLTKTRDGPDIIGVENWTTTSTRLRFDVHAGDKVIYVESLKEFLPYFTPEWSEERIPSIPIIIGEEGNLEFNVVRSVNETANAFVLESPVTTDHLADEAVTFQRQTLNLFKNLKLPANSRTWILLKLVLTDPDGRYDLKMSPQGTPGVFNDAILYPGGYDNGTYKNYNAFTVSVSGSWTAVRKLTYLSVPVQVKVYFG